MPAADQILFNRHYVIGYSYYFRQAKWALEIVDPDKTDVERADNFRSDYRVPPMFRADLADYRNSGFDRGHLVASANQREVEIQNSETFLLSNMSPQHPDLNRKIWKDLEQAVRELDAKKNIYETYVLCGPIFDFNKLVKTIGSEDDNGVTLPVPHSYFKSVLTENNRGTLNMWSFIIPNEASSKPLEDFRVPTTQVEQYSGLFIWERLVGAKIEREKGKIRKMWS
jgi:endonuclease G